MEQASAEQERKRRRTRRRDLIKVLIPFIIEEFFSDERIPRLTSIYTGSNRCQELLAQENEMQFKLELKMSKEAFLELNTLLVTQGGLQASPKVSTSEKIMIFIQVLLGHSYGHISSLFQHGMATISEITHSVVNSMERRNDKFISFPTGGEPTSSKISNDTKFSKYFGQCIGAIDGTHIQCVVPNDEAGRFRDRFGKTSQNVVCACNFDLTFSFFIVDYEGSAHDQKVLQKAYDLGFTIPEGKYLLGDAGFTLTGKVLTPYRSVNYHMQQFRQGGRRPQNYKELFNLRHSSLRTTIERCFGILKKDLQS